MKFLLPLLCLVFGTAFTQEKLPLHPVLQQVADADIFKIYVGVPTASHTNAEAEWMLTSVERDVLLAQLKGQPRLSHPHDAIFDKLGNPIPNYHGVHIEFETYSGAAVPGLTVFDGRVRTSQGGSVIRPDAGREMEIWLYGTAKTRGQQLLAVQAIPIFTFTHCLNLGNLIIESTPRQCLLPDNNLLLESTEKVTVADLAVRDFDSCLQNGKALIDAFPRRCLAAGGRVFTEPPRLLHDIAPVREVDLDAFIEEVRGDTIDALEDSF